MIFGWLRPSPRVATIDRLYGAIVAQARDPLLYQEIGVPDTSEGRFEMIVLHVFLLLERLQSAGERERALGQDLFDRLWADVDANLREMGVGDLAIPKRMKALAEAYYGRATAYRNGLADAGETLAGALARNVFGQAKGAPGAAPLADYVRRSEAQLASASTEALVQGLVQFPPVTP